MTRAFAIADDDHPIVPVDGPWHLSSPFGPRVHPVTGVVGKMHFGVDLAAPEGTPVVAYRRGTVEFVRADSPTAGRFCIVKHDDGTRSRYLDMGSFDPALHIGATVARGQKLGTVGNPPGVSTGMHVHFETREPGAMGTGAAVNPVLIVPGLSPNEIV